LIRTLFRETATFAGWEGQLAPANIVHDANQLPGSQQREQAALPNLQMLLALRISTRQMLPYQHRDPPDVRRRFRDEQLLAVRLDDRYARIRLGLYRLDLIPRRQELSPRDAVLVDRDHVSFLEHPADHCEDVDDEKRRRQDKVHKALLEIKEDQGDKKEKEREDGDDRGALQEQRRDAVRADESAKLFLTRMGHSTSFREFGFIPCDPWFTSN